MRRVAALLTLLAVGVVACVEDTSPDDELCASPSIQLELVLEADALTPADPSVCRGQTVGLTVMSHVDGVLHVHGYDETTLLPIAAGYMVAHYLTLVIQGAIWLPTLLVDPMVGIAPALDWIPVSMVWYLSVAGIVGGHVAGVILAHRLARRNAPHRAVLSGLPMVALMIGYTVFSLWIIAQPIVIEPGVLDLGA